MCSIVCYPSSATCSQHRPVRLTQPLQRLPLFQFAVSDIMRDSAQCMATNTVLGFD